MDGDRRDQAGQPRRVHRAVLATRLGAEGEDGRAAAEDEGDQSPRQQTLAERRNLRPLHPRGLRRDRIRDLPLRHVGDQPGDAAAHHGDQSVEGGAADDRGSCRDVHRRFPAIGRAGKLSFKNFPSFHVGGAHLVHRLPGGVRRAVHHGVAEVDDRQVAVRVPPGERRAERSFLHHPHARQLHERRQSAARAGGRFRVGNPRQAQGHQVHRPENHAAPLHRQDLHRAVPEGRLRHQRSGSARARPE